MNTDEIFEGCKGDWGKPLWEIYKDKTFKIDKIFDIIDTYSKKGIKCCEGCFYQNTASCTWCDYRVPLCIEQILKHTGIDYTDEVNNWYKKEAQ